MSRLLQGLLPEGSVALCLVVGLEFQHAEKMSFSFVTRLISQAPPTGAGRTMPLNVRAIVKLCLSRSEQVVLTSLH